jgi:hypothetical protein
MPSKHRVLKEDGTLDVEASARKNAEAYVGLERRLGAGGVPPPSPGEYKIEAPDALKDAFKPEDPGFKEFLTAAHGAGMTQKQIDVAMGAFFTWAPKLSEAQQTFDMDGCIAELKQVWTDPTEFRDGFAQAHRAVQTFGGERMDRLVAKFGNDPDFVWYSQQVGRELKEDRTPNTSGSAPSDIAALESHPAYSNAKHPEHDAVSARVRAWYANHR